MSEATRKPMVTDVFVDGARKGWNIATNSTIPNILMAFVIMKALQITGALDLIGTVFSPVMGLFGLPGAAATALLGGWLSTGGGIGVIVMLFDSGAINGTHVAILAPALCMMGSQIQYAGRILGVIGTEARLIPVMMAISIINACAAMMIMNLFV